ncbi:uncharacterized protein LOC133726719 [Rosa rugosa]|uniref:uncharacterized protein LOC133726719 n=1 Tax=Rosa rugosa TaxID=74645 RepID=UPI002B40624D|nr:uncharacterized protein LOC133726719 [Rosa rugosa]
MDRAWIKMDRRSPEYEVGVDMFLDFVSRHASDPNQIRCPCLDCGNVKPGTIRTIKDHLFCIGIINTYDVWYYHGEDVPSSSSTNAKRENYKEDHFRDNTVEMVQAAHEDFVSNPEKFEQLLVDAEKPIYPGCVKFSKLSTLVRLYNMKAKGGWPDVSFSELLTFLEELLPANNEMPLNLYEAKKTLCALGLEYEKIHACPNDCILYRKEYKDAIACPTCGLSRWKVKKTSDETLSEKKKKAQIPAKVLWYFPPIPRFRRMFRTKKTAENLIWHAQDREDDGKLRHPADSPQWKLVDYMWPEFGSEPRNLRLAISADGINPHSSLSSRYSCWPVIMVNYNLPPWLCMKRKFMMLTMLISGPKQPGNDIDIYLAPLIDDLKTLWEVGVEAYDAYAQERFVLKAVLLWTINDFPAYGNLCGCSVKGYYACPICSEKTHSKWLNSSKKVSYTGHRRFLPRNHRFRAESNTFYGEQEFGSAPEPLTGEEILQKVEGIKYEWGKKTVKLHQEKKAAKETVKLGKRKIRDGKKLAGTKNKVKKKKDDLKSAWKKKSIFFDLPYWKELYVRHCLDVMHIEKNVCESIIGTLLNIPGKTKDGVAAREDLISCGVRAGLAPKPGKRKAYLPPAPYTLSKDEKLSVCDCLAEARFAKGCCSNFKNLVSMQDLKLLGLKSHDCHMLMQQLFPVAIRAVLPNHVRYAITRFCLFFNALCSKTMDIIKLDAMQDEIVVTLCLLEKIFPPSFFDIMVHVTVHLVREVRLCGPVYLRWMYPFERYMKFLKDYVRNRNRPEGCMAECYIAEEAIEFCADFLSDVSTVGIPLKTYTLQKGIDTPLSVGRVHKPGRKLLRQAHLCVLINTPEVMPYLIEHEELLKIQHPKKSKSEKWLRDEQNRTFQDWLNKE